VTFQYPCKDRIRRQTGYILPAQIVDKRFVGDNPIGIEEQRSEGTGQAGEPFVRLEVKWGRGFASFDLAKIISGTFAHKPK
jgi:hypothetical protein